VEGQEESDLIGNPPRKGAAERAKSAFSGLPLPVLYRVGLPVGALLEPIPLETGESVEEFLVAFCERVIEREPCCAGALVLLAEAYTAQGEYARGLRLDLRLRELRPDDPVVLYNLACSLSLTGEIDEALEALREAVGCGWRDFALLKRDPDMANVRKDPRWDELVKGLVKRK